MSSCMHSRTSSHTTRYGPSRTTTRTFHFEADAPWGRNLMLTNMPNQPSNSISGRRRAGGPGAATIKRNNRRAGGPEARTIRRDPG